MPRRPALVLLAFLVFLPCSAFASGYALVVGIDRYAQPGITVLEGAENDAASLAATLEQALGIPRDNILLYTSSGNQKPTTGTIVKGLEYAARKAGPDDLFVLAFSGHGVSAGGESYLLTYHSEMGALRDTALPLGRVRELVAAIKARRKLLVLDACRNDPEAGKGDRSNPLTAEFARGLSLVPDQASRNAVTAVLFSCEVGQRSYEMPGRKRGFFSWGLEQGLSGKAADGSGRVSLGGLVSYLRRTVPDELARTLGVDKQQTPYAVLEGGDPGNWVLNRMAGKDWEKEMALRKKEMERLEKAEAEQAAARDKQTAEEQRFKGHIADLDARIKAMRQRLGTDAAGKGDSLDAMLAMVRDKEDQERELEALRHKREQEEAARRAELERLEREKREQRRKAFQEDFKKYKEIVDSKYGKDMAGAALQELKQKYPEGEFSAWLEGSWTDPVTGIEFVWIPGECFTMGQGEADKVLLLDSLRDYAAYEKHYGDEVPLHEVCVDGFWLGKTEVTQGQWKKLMGNNPSSDKWGDNYPVESVSWNNAQQFISKLNGGGEGKFRLPTEAEWEYACRAGTKTPWYWGETVGKENAHCLGCSAKGGKLNPVGLFPPNGFGLYDMSGCVFEWVQDVYDSMGYSKHSRNNPVSAGGGPDRVIRGGGYSFGANQARCANRDMRAPDFRGFYVGLRLARNL